MLEIERKFMVKNTTFLVDCTKKYQISQGYLNSDPSRTVRVRTKNEKGYLTIKGKGNLSGTTRFEWEIEIPYVEAVSLLSLCEEGVISKTRHAVDYEGKTFEVDVFHDQNQGLVLAEIELNDEKEFFEKPEWLGEEVTGDQRFYNAYLSQHPFLTW